LFITSIDKNTTLAAGFNTI